MDCEPGFLNGALNSLEAEVKNSLTKKDCSLIIDTMAIRKQTVVDPKGKEQYVGFVNYGPVTPEDPDTLANRSTCIPSGRNANSLEVSSWLFLVR